MVSRNVPHNGSPTPNIGARVGGAGLVCDVGLPWNGQIQI
jgi:hypothetical protein